LDFDTLRQRAEAFLQKYHRALYQRHTGLLADIPIQQVYETPGIFTREVILHFKEALSSTAEAEQSGLRPLWVFLIEGYLRLNVARFDEDLARHYDQFTQSGAWVRHDALNAYPLLAQTIPDDVSRQLIDLYDQRWQALSACLADIELDLLSYLQLIGGEQPLQLMQQASAFLSETETSFQSGLNRLRRQHGPIESRVELERMLTGGQFAAGFPEVEQVPTVEDTLYHLGIDVTHQPNLALEVNRSLLPGSAMAFPVRVPEEVYLVVSPAAGLCAYEQFLRVTGMIMPKLLLSPKHPWAARRLAPHSIAEAYGELLAGLLCNSHWLVDLLDLDDVVGDLVEFCAFRRLYHLRRAAARLFHLVNRAQGKNNYSSIFQQALGVTIEPSSLWVDMGWQRRAIPTWRGLMAGQRLEAALLQQYGPSWYRDINATARLRQLWSAGEFSCSV
jgi:hypothetical protein